MGVGWPRGLPRGKLSPRARCCPQGQPSLRARGEDLLTSTFLSDFLHWRQIRAVNPESFCLEDSICSRKIPKTAAGNVPSQLPSLPSAPGSISSCVFFEPIPAASSVSEPERAPLTVFSELLGIQNVGFFIFSCRPQHGAGMLVDTKPLSADLQTALKATGKQDPARASGLPPSHSTAGPEPGRGPGSSGTTALSPAPWPALFPATTPPTDLTCAKAAKNLHPAQKRSEALLETASPPGSSRWPPEAGPGTWTDSRPVSSRKLIRVPSVDGGHRKKPDQRARIRCHTHVLRGGKLGISQAGAGAKEGIFSHSIF